MIPSRQTYLNTHGFHNFLVGSDPQGQIHYWSHESGGWVPILDHPSQQLIVQALPPELRATNIPPALPLMALQAPLVPQQHGQPGLHRAYTYPQREFTPVERTMSIPGFGSEAPSLLLAAPTNLDLEATRQIRVEGWNIEGDIRCSSCPDDSGPNLGQWLLDSGHVYSDATVLFDMTPRELQLTVSTGIAPDETARRTMMRVTGIALIPVASYNLQRDMNASNRLRPMGAEFGEFLSSQGESYESASEETGIPVAVLSRAVLHGYVNSQEHSDKIYNFAGIAFDVEV